MQPIRQDMLDHAVACAAPIYIRHHDAHPESVGSGVVLRISDRAFLVTAAHVLDVARPWDAPHVGLGDELFPLRAKAVGSRLPALGRAADPFDVAVAELELRGMRGKSVPGVSPSQMDSSEADLNGEVFRLLGFPCQTQDSRISNDSMEATVLHLNVVASATSVERRTGRLAWLKLDYHPEEMLVNGERGKATPLPGMSGAGIWHWREDGTLRLAAIFTDYFKGHASLRGTRMWAALLGVRKLAPELGYLI